MVAAYEDGCAGIVILDSKMALSALKVPATICFLIIDKNYLFSLSNLAAASVVDTVLLIKNSLTMPQAINR